MSYFEYLLYIRLTISLCQVVIIKQIVIESRIITFLFQHWSLFNLASFFHIH